MIYPATGFGGANAHAIVEEHVKTASDTEDESTSFVPFVFSALNEASLIRLLKQYSQALSTGSGSHNINASDLAWTLHSRRSQLATRVAFPASAVEQLSAN